MTLYPLPAPAALKTPSFSSLVKTVLTAYTGMTERRWSIGRPNQSHKTWETRRNSDGTCRRENVVFFA